MKKYNVHEFPAGVSFKNADRQAWELSVPACRRLS
jgi:hypothetical protein